MGKPDDVASIDDEVAAELVWVALDRPQAPARNEVPEVVPDHPRCPRPGDGPLQPVRAIDPPLRIEQEREPVTGLPKPEASPPFISERNDEDLGGEVCELIRVAAQLCHVLAAR